MAVAGGALGSLYYVNYVFSLYYIDILMGFAKPAMLPGTRP